MSAWRSKQIRGTMKKIQPEGAKIMKESNSSWEKGSLILLSGAPMLDKNKQDRSMKTADRAVKCMLKRENCRYEITVWARFLNQSETQKNVSE